MKNILCIITLLFIHTTLFGQEPNPSSEKKGPGKGKINVQFVAGLLNSTPVGITAKAIRDDYQTRESDVPSFSGGLFPKTSAYVGFNLDFQVHKVGAIGTGLTYTPKGYWNFKQEQIFTANLRTKQFITVDYFEIPFFYKEYFNNKRMSLRFGPVINFAVLSKNRTISKFEDEKTKEKTRLGENGGPLPKEIVPGFEASFSYGNMAGIHGNIQFQYMGSIIKEADLRSVIFKLGIGYTFSK